MAVGDPSLPGGPRRQFAYNDAERLGTVSGTEPIATYGYNALGERVTRTVYSTTSYSTYDQDGNWLGDFNSYGAPEQMAIWLDGLPVGLLLGSGSAQTLYYIEADALGSPRAVIDPARNVAIWRWDALGDAYGRDYPQEDPDGDGVALNLDMRLPGQRFDAVSGLHYNGFRDFDPSTGRYIESDPLGLAAGPSTYGYANGSPMAYSDSDGLITGRVMIGLVRYFLPRITARLAMRAATRAGLSASKREAIQAARAAFRAAQRASARSLSCPPAAQSEGLAARFGKAASNDYRGTFFKANPELQGQVRVHHAVEQQVLNRYPGLVSKAEMHSLENLRGIPNELNSQIHLSEIRKAWNQFYRENPNPTARQLLEFATRVDEMFGHLFKPPVR